MFVPTDADEQPHIKGDEKQHPKQQNVTLDTHDDNEDTTIRGSSSDESRNSNASNLPLMMEDFHASNNNSNNINNRMLTREATTTSSFNDNETTDVPSNEKLLGTAFMTFMTFALTQLLFAFIAGSEAMMGDSAAMIVDSITYLFNWIAERQKAQYDLDHSEQPPIDINENPAETARLFQRNRRKLVLQLEIVPPVISVTTLVIVTGFVTKKALTVLQLDMHRDRSEQKLPNMGIMLAFSVVNLCLDVVNVFCFSKANHALGYATEEPDDDDDSDASTQRGGVNFLHDHSGVSSKETTVTTTAPTNKNKNGAQNQSMASRIQSSNSKRRGYRHVNSACEHDTENHDGEKPLHTEGAEDVAEKSGANIHNRHHGDISNGQADTHHHKEHANLNMCSAYTHVFADTLRSIAVIIAAVLAEVLPAVTPEEADATAAVVVSFLILLSLVPLLQGLWRSLAELRAIMAEERSERMFAGAAVLVPQAPPSTATLSSSFELT